MNQRRENRRVTAGLAAVAPRTRWSTNSGRPPANWRAILPPIERCRCCRGPHLVSEVGWGWLRASTGISEHLLTLTTS